MDVESTREGSRVGIKTESGSGDQRACVLQAPPLETSLEAFSNIPRGSTVTFTLLYLRCLLSRASCK